MAYMCRVLLVLFLETVQIPTGTGLPIGNDSGVSYMVTDRSYMVTDLSNATGIPTTQAGEQPCVTDHTSQIQFTEEPVTTGPETTADARTSTAEPETTADARTSTANSYASTSSNPCEDIKTKSELTTLFNTKVVKAERMERPIEGIIVGRLITHAGVRVTTADGKQWLVHKEETTGESDTVVTSANCMDPKNWTVKETKVCKCRTVDDFVKAGGPKWDLLIKNCWKAARDMMKLCEADEE